MVANAGAGPRPIPPKQLSVDALAEAITYSLSEEARAAAFVMGGKIRAENGVENGVAGFHKHLPLKEMRYAAISVPISCLRADLPRCEVDPSRVAVWWSDKLCLRLSAAVAGLLQDQGILSLKDLDMYRASRVYSDPPHTRIDSWQGQRSTSQTSITRIP
jgi:hypothetical protein